MNGQDVDTPQTKKITAHIACEDDGADNNGDYNDDNDDSYDETAAFLAGVLSDSRSETGYDTMQASAMMLDDTLFFGGSDPAPSINEVPRLSLDENPGGQIHVDREHGLSGASSTVPPTNEVPRPSLDENLGGQIHVDGGHGLASPPKSPSLKSGQQPQTLLSRPTQAVAAA